MHTKGFTLIEMLVAVGLFAIVMVIALGALLSLSQSDRKAESLKSVIDSLDFSLDGMSRSIRTGTSYYCGPFATQGATNDCKDPGGDHTQISFTASDGSFISYRYNPTCTGQVGCIEKNAGSGWLPLTSPEVHITSLNFYVVGSAPGSAGDTLQPKVTILLHGYIPVTGNPTSQDQCNPSAFPGNSCSVFNLQTSVTQRVYDK